MVPITGIDNLADMFNSIIQYIHYVFFGTLVFLVYKWFNYDGKQAAPEGEKSGLLKNVVHAVKSRGPADTNEKRELNVERREETRLLNELVAEKLVLTQIGLLQAVIPKIEVVKKDESDKDAKLKPARDAYKKLEKTFKDMERVRGKEWKELQRLIKTQVGRGANPNKKVGESWEAMEQVALNKFVEVSKLLKQLGAEIQAMEKKTVCTKKAELDKFKAGIDVLLYDMTTEENDALNQTAVLLKQIRDNYRTETPA